MTDPVYTTVVIENLADGWETQRGLRAEPIRSVIVPDAVVDMGIQSVALSRPLIRRLGLKPTGRVRHLRNATRQLTSMFDPVRVTVLGRTCTMDVLESPGSTPALIGSTVLHHLDLVIDENTRRLTGNPAHGGEHVYELY